MLNFTYFFCSFFALDNYVLGPSPVLVLVLFLVLALPKNALGMADKGLSEQWEHRELVSATPS